MMASKEHAHVFQLGRLLEAAGRLPFAHERIAFLKKQVKLGELAEFLLDSHSPRLPPVPAVYVDAGFRLKLRRLIKRMEQGEDLVVVPLDRKDAATDCFDSALPSEAYELFFERYINAGPQ